MIGQVSSVASTQDNKEDIKTATNLLYVPTPVIEELRGSKELLDFLDQIMKLLDSGKTDSMNEIMKLAKDRFQAKYQEGDIQILSGETLMDEALVVLLTLLMLGAQINWLMVKIIIVNYYRILLDERAVSDIPALLSYLAMIFGTPDSNPEAMQKLKEFFPENKVRTSPIVAPRLAFVEQVTGVNYDKFKLTFTTMEKLVRGFSYMS